MEIAGVSRSAELRGSTATILYRIDGDPAEFASGGMVFESMGFEELAELADPGGSGPLREALRTGRGLFVHPGGWQSWSPGWEYGPGDLPPGPVRLIPSLNKFVNRDCPAVSRRVLAGHFIAYFRSGDEYLCVASEEGGALPPVTYRIDRSARRISAEAYAEGKAWSAGETIARLRVFTVRGAFALRDALRAHYGSGERFARLAFLGAGPEERFVSAGYESWYNHYTDISERIIREDLAELDRTENLINRFALRRGKPVVFQIDDGWERAVGDWEVRSDRFPSGLRSLADAIDAEGYIPGLWLAPFIVTRQSSLYRERREWLLRDRRGKPVAAGFNPRWDGTFHCLDLSLPEVIDYLAGLVDRAIDQWGFRYLKLDFLYAGMLEGARARGGAAYEHYDRALRALTSRTADPAGRPVAYLGCGAPLGASYPYLPLSRIGTDTKETWDWLPGRLIGLESRPSAFLSLRDTIGRSFLDGAVYLNDPDVVFMRRTNCSLAETEKELIALVDYLLASQLMFSDNPGEFRDGGGTTDRVVAAYQAIAEACPPRDDFAATALGRDVYRLESRSGDLAGLVNLRSAPFALSRADDPALYNAIAGGTLIVDNLVRDRKDASERGAPLRFSPRSITIVRV